MSTTPVSTVLGNRSVADVAEAIGIDRIYLYRIIWGERYPSRKVERLLCDVLGIRLDKLEERIGRAKALRMRARTSARKKGR